MGVQVLPNFQNQPARSGLHLVTEQPSATMERFSLELPHYASSEPAEARDLLGCMRGIAIALGLQIAVVLSAIGIWKLHLLFH